MKLLCSHAKQCKLKNKKHFVCGNRHDLPHEHSAWCEQKCVDGKCVPIKLKEKKGRLK